MSFRFGYRITSYNVCYTKLLRVLHEREDLLVLGYDSTPEVHHLPDVVVYPTRSDQLPELLEFARDEGLPVVPRGSGTGLSGGSVPLQGGRNNFV